MADKIDVIQVLQEIRASAPKEWSEKLMIHHVDRSQHELAEKIVKEHVSEDMCPRYPHETVPFDECPMCITQETMENLTKALESGGLIHESHEVNQEYADKIEKYAEEEIEKAIMDCRLPQPEKDDFVKYMNDFWEREKAKEENG